MRPNSICARFVRGLGRSLSDLCVDCGPMKLKPYKHGVNVVGSFMKKRREISGYSDLNREPLRPERSALPIELYPACYATTSGLSAGLDGPISGSVMPRLLCDDVQRARGTGRSYKWKRPAPLVMRRHPACRSSAGSGTGESNSRPLAPQASALPLSQSPIRHSAYYT